MREHCQSEQREKREKLEKLARTRSEREALLAREGVSERASEREREREGSTCERERKRTHEGVQPVTCHYR
jgi:hypothetical protein